MMISVKWVTILAIGVCVLSTVTATLVLAVRSTDSAVDKTNAQHDISVDQCFTTGKNNIVELTAQLLEENGRVVAGEIQRFLRDVRNAHSEILAVMQSTPADQIDSIDAFTKYNSLFWSMWMSKSLTMIATGTLDGTGLFITELQRTQDEFRGEGGRNLTSSLILTNNASTGTTLYGTLANRGGFTTAPCDYLFISTGVVSGPCPGPSTYNLTTVPIVVLGIVDRLGLGTPTYPDVAVPLHWGRVHNFPDFAGITLSSTFSSDPPHPDRAVSGHVQVSHDLRSVSNVIKKHVSAHLTVFTVIGGANKQLGLLIGVSAGNSTELITGPHPVEGSLTNLTAPSHCVNASDEIISGACASLFELGGGEVGKHEIDPFQAVFAKQSGNATELTINGSLYFVHVTELSDKIGLTWWVVTLEEEAVILGSINRQRSIVQDEIHATSKRVNDDLNRDRLVMYVVIISVVAIMFILSTLGTMVLAKPLELLKREMEDVAKLNLDDLDTNTTRRSFLKEVSSMQTSFLTMVASMKEYKQYMPQALLQREDEMYDTGSAGTDDSDDEVHKLPHISTPGGQATLNSDTSDSRRKHDSSTEHVPTTVGSSSPAPGLVIATSNVSSGKKKAALLGGLGIYLVKKSRASQLTVCCSDFNRYIKLCGEPSTIVEFHSRWLHMVVTDVKEHQGMVQSFIADNVDITFGSLSSCISPATKAAKYALQIRNRLTALRPDMTENTQPAIGLATGSVYVGNMGCTGSKAPAVLGRAVQQSKVMQTIAMEISLDIVMDQMSADELKGVIVYTPIEIIKTESGKLQTAYYLAEAHHAGAGEWMYTMDVGVGEGESYNRGWDLLVKGQLSAAADVFDALTDSEAACALVPRIRSYIDDVCSLTGMIPTEYSRSIRPRSTLPAPISDHCFLSRKVSLKPPSLKARETSSRNKTSSKVSSCPSLTNSGIMTKSAGSVGASPPAVRMIENSL